MAEQALFPTQELTFSYNSDLGCFVSLVAPPPFAIQPGEDYRVVWGDAGSFQATALDVSAALPGVIAMGNGAPFGFPGNNEPFVIAVTQTDVAFLSTTDVAPVTRSVAVYQTVADPLPQPEEEYLIQGNTLQGIANAIRQQLGSDAPIPTEEMAEKILQIAGSGGSSSDVRYVTFFSEDGSVEYGKKAVAVGDDCADPIDRGLFVTPSKDATAQYHYTFAGWSTQAGGGLDSNALKSVTEDRAVYANFAAAVVYYTIRFYDGDSLLQTQTLPYGTTITYAPSKSGSTFLGWLPEAVPVTGNADYQAQWEARVTFANGSWAQIAQISESGRASEYFAVGDTKEIAWNGRTYTLAILGFDHDDLADGTGKAGMTIGFITSTPDKIAAISNQQNTYICWGHSYCRVYNTIVGYKSHADLADIVAVAKPVFKYSYREVDDKNQKTTDTFFALSSTEVGGSAVTTGSKYAYFTDANKRKMLNVSTGGYASYLLRDAAITSSYKYWYFVESSGTVGSYAPAATANYYPIFAFCV